jgi:hypothetical protein
MGLTILDSINPNPGFTNHVRSMPLMTVSTTVITVLHSAEVVHVPHES